VDSRRYNEVQFRDARVVHQQSDTAHSTRTRVTTPTRQANQRTQRVHEGKLRLGCNSCNQFGGRRSADVVVPRKHDVRGRLKLAQRSDRFPTRCTLPLRNKCSGNGGGRICSAELYETGTTYRKGGPPPVLKPLVVFAPDGDSDRGPAQLQRPIPSRAVT
jgi:hypothetical protein